MHVCMHVFMYVCVCLVCMHLCMYVMYVVQFNVFMYVCNVLNVCMCVCACKGFSKEC